MLYIHIYEFRMFSIYVWVNKLQSLFYKIWFCKENTKKLDIWKLKKVSTVTVSSSKWTLKCIMGNGKPTQKLSYQLLIITPSLLHRFLISEHFQKPTERGLLREFCWSNVRSVLSTNRNFYLIEVQSIKNGSKSFWCLNK